MARVAEAEEHGTDGEIACWREMGEEERRRDAQEKEEASKKAKKRTRTRKGSAANARSMARDHDYGAGGDWYQRSGGGG